MNRLKYSEWIDDYVEGNIGDSRKKEFEAELAINGELAFEYRIEKDLNEVLSDEEMLDFSIKCMTMQNEMRLSTHKLAQVVQLTRKYWYAAASLFLIILIAGGIYLLHPGDYSSEKLFKMYYKSGEAIGISRSGNITMAEAMLAFSRSNYSAADVLFDQILQNEPQNFAVYYYAGISNIELKNFDKAIQMFDVILNNNNNLYTEYAEWYSGLSLLASDRVDQAIVIFSNIHDSDDHLYKEEAGSILSKLDKGVKNKKILNNLFFLILPF